MADCSEYQELMSAMLDGELNEADRAKLAAHLAVCPACSALYGALRDLSGLSSAQEEPPESLKQNIMTAVEQKAAGRKRRRLRAWLIPTAAAAACLAVALLTVPGLLAQKNSAQADDLRAVGSYATEATEGQSAANSETSAAFCAPGSSGEECSACTDAGISVGSSIVQHTADQLNCRTLIEVYGALPFELTQYAYTYTEEEGVPEYIITVDEDLAQQLIDTDQYYYSVDRSTANTNCLVLYFPVNQ